MQIDKGTIENLKQNDPGALTDILRNGLGAKDILLILENLGHLPEGFNGDVFMDFITHENDQIRFWAIKNLGKIRKIKYAEWLYYTALHDKSSIVRREAVSSLGRMRNENVIPKLIEFLGDQDPKVVLQAIRGLLVFEGNESIRNSLKTLIHHPNEMVQQVINKEFSLVKIKSSTGSHVESPTYLQNCVIHGDVREILNFVEDEAVHLTFTSPPYYNARDYSVYNSYDEYLNFLGDVFNKVHRITKEGRFFILNTSPIIIPRVSRSHSSKRYPIPFDIHHHLVNNGWEFIDDIVWMKPEYSSKNRVGGFGQHRKPLGYKPNAITEYLMVYRKKTDRLIDWNIHQYSQDIVSQSRVKDKYETSNVWQIDPCYDKVHSAVFPVGLCERVIRYYSYVGDLVFDPFAGTGTVGKAALKLKRRFFLTESEEIYCERIRQSLGDANMFPDSSVRHLTFEQFKTLRIGEKL
jgi:DNA modification methylase